MSRAAGGALRTLLSSFLVSAVATLAYFELPFTSSGSGLVLLVVGLLAVTALLCWHLYAIVRSAYPRVRAVGALATVVPLFLLVFAGTYWVMQHGDPQSFSEPLGRLDALYFAVTVFATVGFGDIVPLTVPARAVATVQMVCDLVLVGLVAQVIVGAARQGVRRKQEGQQEGAQEGTPPSGPHGGH